MTDSLRPKSLVPPYPPYKVGALLEEYVYDRLKDQNFGDFQYIDAFWTNLYSNRSFAGVQFNIQPEIDSLDREGKYFTVCQNDDGVLERLPNNTIKFCAGGNKSDENTIPIPLVVNGFPTISEEDINRERTILASFVGSNTHTIRVDMHKALKGFQDVKMTMKGWDINVNGDQFNNFISDSLSSYFVLAPRGYGKTSFRLYEAIMMERIPVYISDSHFLPYTELMDWNSISILCGPNDISSLHSKMKNLIDSGEYFEMVDNIKRYKHMFTIDFIAGYIKSSVLNFEKQKPIFAS